jgi:hypothetical protein
MKWISIRVRQENVFCISLFPSRIAVTRLTPGNLSVIQHRRNCKSANIIKVSLNFAVKFHTAFYLSGYYLIKQFYGERQSYTVTFLSQL